MNIEKEFLAEESGLDDSVFADSYEMSWQDGLIIRMLDFDFIKETQVDEALSILNKFENEDEAWEKLNNSDDELSQAIANATQI